MSHDADTVTPRSPEESPTTGGKDFIRTLVDEDLRTGRHGRVHTRFPPEPNGYLHIGHAKSIVLNFGLAAEYDGLCNLRFDDTNPLTEDEEYVRTIQEDVRWLGYDWDGRLFHASDYFERLHDCALQLIDKGLAYVDSSTEEEIRRDRGTVTEPGRPSRWRDRTPAENRGLFARMRAGEFPDGSHVLRARIDLASPNMKMRDPLLYRIRHASHYRTGDRWCIYPMYDFTHGLSDAFEGITHSLCTLEFENNRELYDWFLEKLELPRPRPQQIEFARLNLNYTVMSKRKLLQLVEEGLVDGWDDPRMPTLSGLRRRGVRPEAIRDFCDRIGVAKANSTVDVALLEHAIRNDLNFEAPRVLAVLRPLRVTVTNVPEGETVWLDAPSWPHDVPREGSRRVPFSRELLIERDDFALEPPKGWRRLAPGWEVRLRYAYVFRCEEVERDPASGEVIGLRGTIDPETIGGKAKQHEVKGTIHWVSASHALPAEVRLYDRLFSAERPDQGGVDFRQFLNPESLEVLDDARVEPSLADAGVGSRFQFERHGYFFLDASTGGKLRFNRIVTLRDTWAKLAERQEAPAAAQPALPSAPTPPPAGAAPDPWAGVAADQRRRMELYRDQHDIPPEDSRLITDDPALAELFELALAGEASPRAVANWVVNELKRELKGRSVADLPFGGREIGRLVRLVESGAISGPTAKQVFEEMLAGGGDPEAIVDRRGLRQLDSDDAVAPFVDAVLAAHPGEVEQYRAGKAALLGFFTGQVMQRTRGRANPQRVQALLRARLG